MPVFFDFDFAYPSSPFNKNSLFIKKTENKKLKNSKLLKLKEFLKNVIFQPPEVEIFALDDA